MTKNLKNTSNFVIFGQNVCILQFEVPLKYLKQKKKKLDRLRHYYFNFIVCLISASSYPYNDLGANSTFKPPKSRFYEPDQFLKSILGNLTGKN